MDNSILLALIGIGEAVITGVVTFLLTKKKYQSEVDGNIIDNMKESLEFYKQLSDDNKQRLEEVLEKNKRLEDEVDELRKIVFGMLSQICTDIMCQSRKSELTKSPLRGPASTLPDDLKVKFYGAEDSETTVG